MEEEQTQDWREILHAYRDLVRSAGWELLGELIEAQIKTRDNHILAMELNGIEDVMELQALKNERKGLKLAMQLPELVIQTIENDHDKELNEDAEDD